MRTVALLLAVTACLAGTGCAALVIGGAAAGAAGVIYARGDEERVYPYPIETVWQAAMVSLAEMRLQVGYNRLDALKGRIEAYSAANDKIKIEMESRGDLTELELRVNTFGDEAMSLAILHQIDHHLAQMTPPAVPYYGEPTEVVPGPVGSATEISPSTPTR